MSQDSGTLKPNIDRGYHDFKNCVSDLNLLLRNVENGQTHIKNLAAFAARFLKCVEPFYDIAK